MFKHRVFSLLIILVLVVAAFAVSEAIAKADGVAQENLTTSSKAVECVSLPSRYSLHTEIVTETGPRLPYTENGPTGIDGGLINLLSNYLTCSR